MYSNEFFEFVLQILNGVSEISEVSNADKVKFSGLLIAKKAGFEVLARCSNNASISKVAQIMIDILKTSDALCKTFLKTIID